MNYVISIPLYSWCGQTTRICMTYSIKCMSPHETSCDKSFQQTFAKFKHQHDTRTSNLIISKRCCKRRRAATNSPMFNKLMPHQVCALSWIAPQPLWSSPLHLQPPHHQGLAALPPACNAQRRVWPAGAAAPPRTACMTCHQSNEPNPLMECFCSQLASWQHSARHIFANEDQGSQNDAH